MDCYNPQAVEDARPAGRKNSSSSSPISIGDCKVDVEGNNFICRSSRNSVKILVPNAANINIAVNSSRKYSTRKHSKGLKRSRFGKCEEGEGHFSFEDYSLLLVNPKEINSCSKDLLQEAINIYMKELPTMNYAANTGKESSFIEKCVANGKYCTLLLKSNSMEGFGGVIAAVTYQIIPADTQYAEIPLAAVSSIHHHKGIGHLLYMELRQRLQNVGICTIFCWGDKESEGFWLKQGFVSIAEVDTRGKVRRLPFKADIRRALCFPGNSTLMVSHLNKDTNVLVNPSDSLKFCFPLKALVKLSSSSHDKIQGLGGIGECYVTAKATAQIENPEPEVLVDDNDRHSTDDKIIDGSSPSCDLRQGCTDLVPWNGADCDNKITALGVAETVDDTDVMYCSCSANGLKRRLWEASWPSLNSKRVNGSHQIDCQLETDWDFVCKHDREKNSCYTGCSLETCRNKSLMWVTQKEPLTSNMGIHAEESRPVHVMSNDWISDDFRPKGACFFRIMLMNIADDAKKACLTKAWVALLPDGSVSTHVITGKVRRTLNFCTALCSGAWIISPSWLKACFKEGRFLSELPFVLKDEDYVLKYRSELKDAVLRAKASPRALLTGYDICLATRVQPPVNILSPIVRSAGGNVLHDLDKVQDPLKTIFVACEEDMEEALLAVKRRV